MFQTPNHLPVALTVAIWMVTSVGHSLQAQNTLGQASEKQIPANESSGDAIVRFELHEGHADIFLGDMLFTRLQHTDSAKPYFYPVHAPGKVNMTRHWPLDKSNPDEPVDHPHHKALWFSHIINGVDFWAEKGGSVQIDQLEVINTNPAADDPSQATGLKVNSKWLKKPDHSVVLTDQTIYEFGGDQQHHWIDATIEFRACHGEVVFEDTKEGMFAIRVPSSFQFDSQQKKKFPDAVGTARNSNGQVDSAIWGQSAKWVAYQGQIDNQPYAIAMFDHPSNLRHPTTWHARDYGLFAANPFGLHDFKRAPRGSGQHRLADGETLQLRYRVLFIAGHPTDQQLENWYHDF